MLFFYKANEVDTEPMVNKLMTAKKEKAVLKKSQ